MLVLNVRFTLLAAFCTLVTLVSAAAIQSRSVDRGRFHNVASDRPSTQYVLPLPLQSNAKQFKVRMHEWLHSNPMALLADIAFAHLKRDDNASRVACKFRKRGDHSDPAEFARRSLVIPDNHGNQYIVSHSSRPVHQRQRRPKARMLSRTEDPKSRRSQEATVVGHVALMSPTDGSATGRQLGMLYAVPEDPGTWTLYASDKNQTQFRMVGTHDNVESVSDLTPVMLEMDAPGETRTCATYNSNPPQDGSDADENMTMEPCTDRANPETGSKSQIFMYDGSSGRLEPTWNSGPDGVNTTAADSPANQNATNSTTSSIARATTSSAVQAAATLFANRENIPPNTTKQNSTAMLVFTPVKAMVADIGTQQNSTATTETTLTMTKTVTVFNLASTSTGVSSSAASQVTSSALDVQLVGAPISSTGSTTTTLASVSTSSSTATRSIDAAAIASGIAASASASSASASASQAAMSSSSVSPSSTQGVERRRANRRRAAKLNTISTEPYTWVFKSDTS